MAIIEPCIDLAVRVSVSTLHCCLGNISKQPHKVHQSDFSSFASDSNKQTQGICQNVKSVNLSVWNVCELKMCVLKWSCRSLRHYMWTGTDLANRLSRFEQQWLELMLHSLSRVSTHTQKKLYLMWISDVWPIPDLLIKVSTHVMDWNGASLHIMAIFNNIHRFASSHLLMVI